MKITTRAGWGARTPNRTIFTTNWNNRTGFVVHYSAANKNQSVRAIQDYHIGKGWGDVGYNFLVRAETGEIYEGRYRTWVAVGAHVAGHNTANIGVCVIGTNSDITDAAKRSLKWLYLEANRRAGRTLARNYHSKMPGAATECPGSNLRKWVIAGMPITQINFKLGDRILKVGMEGSDVKELQIGLNKLGNELLVDEDYGSFTALAVKELQTSNGLVGSGVFDSKTFTVFKLKIRPTNILGVSDMLFFAKTKGNSPIYVGNGLYSRHITNKAAYLELVAAIQSTGQPVKLHEFETDEATFTFVGKRIDLPEIQ